MATNYPTSVDSFTAPGASLAGPPTHESVHVDLADAIEATQTELGVNGRHRTMRSYADSAARDAANASPSAGHIAFLEDSDTITVYNGSAWVDVMDDWRPRVSSISETGLTESWTALASIAAIGSAQTFTKPATWTTYDLHITGRIQWSLTLGDDVYTNAKIQLDATTDGIVTTGGAVSNWRGSNSFYQTPLQAVFSGLSADASLRVWFAPLAISGTSPQIDLDRYDLIVHAVRVT